MSVYPVGVEVRRSASISHDGRFRYTLHRGWGTPADPFVRRLMFVMLNPSTADHQQDDPTIRRCVGFARSLGCTWVSIFNLYAYRATKPADLWLADDPTGGDRNDDLLREIGQHAVHGQQIIAAWGAHARADRVQEVLAMPGWDKVQCLGVTKSGAPRHPLYLPATAQPTVWPGARRLDGEVDRRG